jgi:hypothetical protein
MATKLNCLLFILLITFVLTPGCDCKKISFDCTKQKYGFNLSVIAYPNKDTVVIGDTIWFEINSPTKLRDTITGQIIEYVNVANLGSLLSFDRLSVTGEFTDHSANRFNFLLRNGREIAAIDANWEKNYLFTEANNKYIFLLGVVPKEKGIYSILFSRAANVYRSTDECTKANFNIIFENTDQHYPLNPFYIPGTNPKGGDYYFIVR